METEIKRVEVLGMELMATDYVGGVKLLEDLAKRKKAGMVAAAMLLAVISRLPEWLTRMRRREILDRCRV